MESFNGTISATKTGADLTITPAAESAEPKEPIALGSCNEDTVFSISTEQLITQAGFSFSTELSIESLRLRHGEGSLQQGDDGTWTFTPCRTGTARSNLITASKQQLEIAPASSLP